MLSKGRIRSSKTADATAATGTATGPAAAAPTPGAPVESESYAAMLNVKKRLDKMLKTIEDDLAAAKYDAGACFPCPHRVVFVQR